MSPSRGGIVVEPTNKLFPSSARNGIVGPVADCSPTMSPLRGFGFLLGGFYKYDAPTALGRAHLSFSHPFRSSKKSSRFSPCPHGFAHCPRRVQVGACVRVIGIPRRRAEACEPSQPRQGRHRCRTNEQTISKLRQERHHVTRLSVPESLPTKKQGGHSIRNGASLL